MCIKEVERSLETGRLSEQSLGVRLSRKRGLQFAGDFTTRLEEAESLMQFVNLILAQLARQDNVLGEFLEKEQHREAAAELEKQRKRVRVEMEEALITVLRPETLQCSCSRGLKCTVLGGPICHSKNISTKPVCCLINPTL